MEEIPKYKKVMILYFSFFTVVIEKYNPYQHRNRVLILKSFLNDILQMSQEQIWPLSEIVNYLCLPAVFLEGLTPVCMILGS